MNKSLFEYFFEGKDLSINELYKELQYDTSIANSQILTPSKSLINSKSIQTKNRQNNKLLEDYRFSPEYEMMKKYENEDGIYVRFSTRPMIKKIMMTTTKLSEFGSTFHSDPTGVYAFPLKYVLENYKRSNFNMFFSGEYIYVYILKDVSENKFIVNKRFTGSTAGEILKSLYQMDNIRELISNPIIENIMIRGLKGSIPNANKRIKSDLEAIKNNDGSKKIHNVLFFHLTQLNEDYLIAAHNNQANPSPRKSEFLANGDKQRFRWLRAGYDAIEDLGDAIIFPVKKAGEEAQIIFLKEDSFDILDSVSKESQIKAVNMTYGDDEKERISIKDFETHKEKYAYFLRRIIAFIIQNVLKDRLLGIKWKIEDIEKIIWGMEDEQYIKNRLSVLNKYRKHFMRSAMSTEQFLFGIGNKYYVFASAEHRSSEKDEETFTEYGLQEKTFFEVIILEKEYGKIIYNNPRIDSRKFQSFDEFLTFIKGDIETNIAH